MLSKNYIHNINKVIVVLGISLLVASCGTYEYVGYNNDGIYSEVPSSQRVLTEVQTVETVDSDAGYYKNYFQERKREVDAVVAQSDIFTDVDDYSSDYTQPQDTLAMRTGYSGWGQTNDVVNINFYNNGWNNWGWDPWLWGPGWGWNRWGVGWGTWGLGWGWNNWGWGIGWNGWGWDPWLPGPGWGWGGFYGPGWGWGPGWGVGGFYPYSNNIAFMGSRRGDAFAAGYGRNNTLGRSANLNNTAIGRRSSSALPANSNLRRTVEQNNLRRSGNTRMSTRNTINSRNGTLTRGNSTRANNTSRSSSRLGNTSRSSGSTATTRSSSSSRSSGGTMRSGGSSRGGSMGGGSRGGGSMGGGGRRGG